MPQIQRHQIENHTLTGASLNKDLGLYDETENYILNSIVSWKNTLWKNNVAITGTAEGDLSHAPDISTDWDEERSSIYSVYPSSAQTFTGTRITVNYNTERYSHSDFSVASGEITFNKDDEYLISFTGANGISSGNDRSGSRCYIQLDAGSGFADISNLVIPMYNRDSNTPEDSGSVLIPLSVLAGNKIRIQTVRYDGSSTLTTIPNGYNITIFSNRGSKGLKGDKGDTGADGDITWEGSWSNGTYNENEAVEYNGSSFVCITNGTTNNPGIPSSPNSGWDLLASRGNDGSGTSINIQSNSSPLPNTPHATLNYAGNAFSTVDSGGGVATVTLNNPAYIRFGKSDTQTLTNVETIVALNQDLKADTNALTRSGGRITAARAINLDISYSVHMLLDSGDNARNTLITYIKVNGSRVNYTDGSAYSRGFAYDPNAVANANGIYLELSSGDYFELFVVADDDIQTPVIGNAKTWITCNEIL